MVKGRVLVMGKVGISEVMYVGGRVGEGGRREKDEFLWW